MTPKIAANPNGTLNIIIQTENRTLQVHSSRPIEESVKISSRLQGGTVLLAGLGCGYLLERVLEDSSADCIVYEPESPIFEQVLTARPQLKARLFDPRVVFVRNIETLSLLIQKKRLTNLDYNFNRTYNEIFPEEFTAIHDCITAGIRKKEIGDATLKRFGKIWTKNTLRNMHRFFTSKKLIPYLNWNKPAVVVGAGPSLAEGLSWIKLLSPPHRC